jgi:hypothetical protein
MMRANPGGQLAPDEVLGRDRLIAQLWDILERQSVVLTAERRIGKTQMIKKMRAEAPGDMLTIYRDLEGVRTLLEFVELVFKDVEPHLSGKTRAASKVRQLVQQLAGTEIGGIIKLPEALASHWKRLLEGVVEDLVTHQNSPVVLFWDELPLMIYNIKKRAGEEAAMEVLDVLRQLRQMHGSLRMVFTGSIGLHNVITSLHTAGYANDPTNDMKTINVPPLSSSDAEILAVGLMEGEAIQSSDPEEAARAIAAAVDNVPFYIHHVVYDLKFHAGAVNVAVTGEIVNSRLADPQDEWRMAHYRQRIDTYYTSAQQRLALTVLDILAVDEPLGFDKLFNLVKTHIEIVDEDVEAVREMLTLLQRDHYLKLDAEGRYSFQFLLIRRWWRLHRG